MYEFILNEKRKSSDYLFNLFLLPISFRHYYYYAKSMFLKSLIILIVLRPSHITKFYSNFRKLCNFTE